MGYPYSMRRPLDHRCSGGVSSRPFCISQKIITNYVRPRQSWTQCGLEMMSHNANPQCTWRNVKMDRLAALAADLLQSTVSKCRLMFHLWVPFWTIDHNKYLTLSSCAQQKYFSSHDSWSVRFLACFDRDMFRRKYARRVHPWTFSMLCRWRHWGRGMYLLPL